MITLLVSCQDVVKRRVVTAGTLFQSLLPHSVKFRSCPNKEDGTILWRKITVKHEWPEVWSGAHNARSAAPLNRQENALSQKNARAPFADRFGWFSGNFLQRAVSSCTTSVKSFENLPTVTKCYCATFGLAYTFPLKTTMTKGRWFRNVPQRGPQRQLELFKLGKKRVNFRISPHSSRSVYW